MKSKDSIKILHEIFGNYTTRAQRLFSDVLSAITTNVNSLLMWIKAVYKCWFVIIAVVILGALLGVLVTYNQLQSWDQLSGVSDLERFADLFMDGFDREDEAKQNQYRSRRIRHAHTVQHPSHWQPTP